MLNRFECAAAPRRSRRLEIKLVVRITVEQVVKVTQTLAAIIALFM
jgi:hypothetical protein